MTEPTKVILTGDLDDIDGWRAETEQRIVEALEEIAAPDIDDLTGENLKHAHAQVTMKLAQALSCIRHAHRSLIEAEKGKAK